jgi:hypothetical protein
MARQQVRNRLRSTLKAYRPGSDAAIDAAVEHWMACEAELGIPIRRHELEFTMSTAAMPVVVHQEGWA